MLTLDAVRIEQDGFHLSAEFTLEPGAIAAVLGPSGAGKSTLINAIAGFVPLAGGAIAWQGRDFGSLPPAERPLSILFQDHNLLPHLTVFQNVALGLKPSLRLTASETARVAGALDRVGLSGLHDRKPGQLSGGQISRAGLARVLLRQKPLILLDEPFSALGPALKHDMLDLVADIAGQSGASVMMITHDPQDARRLCPQTLLVAEGSVSAPRDTAALLADPPAALRAYLG
jgi:thiamine transport system ATP-binding protein